MENISKFILSALSAFMKHLPTIGIGVVMVFMFNTVYKGQKRIEGWQKSHGQHSSLVREALDASEQRLAKTDAALDKLQDTLHKTTLVIVALRAEAKTVDKVRTQEMEKLYKRAKILRDKFGLYKTAAAMENRLLRKQLAQLKAKIKYYEKLQQVK